MKAEVMYISQVSIKLHKIYYQADCFYFKFATLSLSGPSMPQAVVLHLQRLSTQHPTLPHGISPLSSLLSPQATCSSSLSPVDDPDSSSTKRIESVVRVPPARPLHFAPYTCLPACRCKVFPHASPSTCALIPTPPTLGHCPSCSPSSSLHHRVFILWVYTSSKRLLRYFSHSRTFFLSVLNLLVIS